MADLNSLTIFAKVVEANSFSEAARRLKMPTSTVSRRVADLEDQLGVRLLERSTRSLRLTDVGSEVLEHAQHSVELSESVDNIASNHLSNVSGTLRLSAPPSISDSLLAPLVSAFQASYPDVRVQIFVTERFVDHIAEGIDLGFRVGMLKDSTLVARRILTYRHQLLASPAYLEKCKPPSWEWEGQGTANVPALPIDERLHRSRGSAARGSGHWRPSSDSEARTPARWTARRSDAELALPHRQPLRGPSRQTVHAASGARIQGIRGANGADALPHPPYLNVA